MSNYNLDFEDHVTEISNILSNDIVCTTLEAQVFIIDSIIIDGDLEMANGNIIMDVGDVILNGASGQVQLNNGSGIAVTDGGVISLDDSGQIELTNGSNIVMTDGQLITINSNVSLTNTDVNFNGTGGITLNNGGDINMTGGEIALTNADITLDGTGDITLTSSANQVKLRNGSSIDINGVGGISIETGPIVTLGNLQITSTGRIDVENGNITATNGFLICGAGINVNGASSDIVSAGGALKLQGVAGSAFIESTGSITTSAGNVIAQTGFIKANAGNVTANNNLVSETGNINANQGNVNVTLGDVNIDAGDLNVTAGDIEVTAGGLMALNGTILAQTITAQANVNGNNVKASRSNVTGSIGGILVSKGTLEWIVGQTDTKSITGLNGDAAFGYKFVYFIDGDPTNSNNHLRMRFNNDSGMKYGTRSTENTGGAVDATDTNGLHFVDWQSTSHRHGSGEASFITVNAGTGLASVYGHGIASTSTTGGGNQTQNWKYAWKYINSLGSILSIQFDPTNNNHDGWILQYRLTRFE